MYVACSTLCFAAQPLDEALRHIRDLNFSKADITLAETGPHLKPSEVAADTGKLGTRLKAANLPIAAFHADFKNPDGDTTRAELRSVCRLARQLAVPLVSTSAAPIGSDLDAETKRLQDWLAIADREGVMLTLETNSHTLTADVGTTLELCKRVPGLGLTLDPSHYIAGPQGAQNYDPLFPYVKHVRLRDSGSQPGAYQVRVGQGDLEYGRIISQLDRCEYDRALCVDVRDLPNQEFPVEPEVRKLKYLLESLV